MQSDKLTDAITAKRRDYEAQLAKLESNDPEFQRLQRGWKNAKEDGSYSSPEFLAMDARRDYLIAQIAE